MDKNYKLKDIPRGHGRKLKFIFTYCRLSLLYICVGVFLLIYLPYLIFFRPRKDVSLALYSDAFNYMDQELLTNGLERTFDWDANGDGIVKVILNTVDFSTTFENLPKSEINTIMVMLSTGDTNIIFASDMAFEWLQSIDFLGTWGDYGDLQGHDPNEIFKVNAGECEYFKGKREEFYKGINICISIKTDATDVGLYEKEMAYLKQLIEYKR